MFDDDKIKDSQPLTERITGRQIKEQKSRERDQINRYYNRKHVKETIIRAADYNGNSRIAIFDNHKIYDLQPTNNNLKLYQNKEKRANSKVKLYQGNNSRRYTDFTNILKRTCYLTLNYLPNAHHRFHEYYDYGDDTRQRIDDFDQCTGFMWSVDIDLVDPHDVDNMEDREMLMKAVQHVYETFKDASKGHVLILFSGGGAYLHLHPAFGALDPSITGEERIKKYEIIRDSFNNMIAELERTFENKYPEYAPYEDEEGNNKKRVKFDRINNINRQIKAPMSLHRSKPYAVLPITSEVWEFPLKPFTELTDDELSLYKHVIFDFLDNDPSQDDLKEFGEYIIQWEPPDCPTGHKVLDKEWKIINNKYPIPNPPYILDVILQEPVTHALCSDKSWNDGNVRRNRIIASILKACGWSLKATKEYLFEKNVIWKTSYDDLDRIIEFGFTMYPPNYEKIYESSGDFSRPGLRDILRYNPDYLPKMPQNYENPVQLIRIMANENIGNSVHNGEDEYEPERTYINLEYPTEHLNGFKELSAATTLFGKEYIPIFKALWYQIMSYPIRESDIKVGQARVDGRIAALYPIPAGHGKGELKRTIKKSIEYFNGQYGEPTSLHAEQLVGKTVKIGKNQYEQRVGYLADDWVVIDESYNLLTSEELHYSEARKYIRSALDRYPENRIHKRTVDIGNIEPLEYAPSCNISLFVQPRTFENDLLVEEGDLRRVLVPYVPMRGVNKTDGLKRNIFDKTDYDSALSDFNNTISKLDPSANYEMTPDAKVKLFELSKEIIEYGFNFSEKVRNYTDIIYYTLPNYLIKFSAVQAFHNGRDTIAVIDVELAFIDLFEIMHHTFMFVDKKIPGLLNYGEGWQGAESLDQEALLWLNKEGAVSLEDSKTQINEYLDILMKLFSVKKRRAQEILKKHKERGWVDNKVLPGDSRIWLNFTPQSSRGARDVGVQGVNINAGIEKRDSKYYEYIDNYDKLLKKK